MLSQFLQSYLRFWAVRYLARVRPQIIAVTGSVGKTSTKDAIFEVLKIKFGRQVRKSEGNLNNETGVPLAILSYKESPSNFLGWLPIIISAPFKVLANRNTKVLVLEMAADKPGDIKYLTSFVKPNIAVLTSIGPAHLEAFGEVEKIIEEKTNLLRALPNDGWAILNVDDEKVKKISYDERWQTKTYAIDEKADVKANNITTEIIDFQPKSTFQIIKDSVKFMASTHTLGRRWNIYSALAGAAVGFIYKMSPTEIVEGLKNIKPEKHRLNVLPGKNGSVIIDDTYNANPISMQAALDVLKILPAGRKIAVLGDMRELGKITDKAHKIIGEYAKEITDEVVSVGELAKKYEARKHFENVSLASQYLLKEIRPGDMIQGVPIILIKASRAVGLEEIVEALRDNSKIKI